MDFMNRGFRNGPNTTNSAEQQHSTAQPAPVSGGKKFGRRGKGAGGNPMINLKNAASLTFLLALVIIVAGTIFAMINFNGNNRESNLVDTSKYQAVFLNGGQVYFGNVKDLNSQYLKLDNIYYLRVNQQVQPDGNATQNANDVSLVKLGCELHGPQDSMVVNREQVIFWENLKNDGQVLKAIDQYKQQFPNGEDCSKQSSTTPSTSGGSTTPSTTTPTTNTKTNKTP